MTLVGQTAKEMKVSDPEGVGSDIYPSLSYDGSPAAIEWLCRAFGFTRRLVVPGQDGGIMHSELSLGSGVIMVSSSKPGSRCQASIPVGVKQRLPLK